MKTAKFVDDRNREVFKDPSLNTGKITGKFIDGSFYVKYEIEKLKKSIDSIKDFLSDFTNLPYKLENRDGELYLENSTVICELDHNEYHLIVIDGNYTIIDNDKKILEFKNNDENFMYVDNFKLYNFLDDLENLVCDIELFKGKIK